MSRATELAVAQGGDAAEGHDVGQDVPAAGPGLLAAQQVGGEDQAAIDRLVTIIRTHPRDRDEIVAWLHGHRGNAFVGQVMAHLGQVERLFPEAIELRAVRASVQLPANRTLKDSFKVTIKTTQPTTLGVEITPTGMSVYFSPGLFVDVVWPMENSKIHGLKLDFATGKVSAQVREGGGWGVFDTAESVASEITGLLQTAINGTPIGTAGYIQSPDPISARRCSRSPARSRAAPAAAAPAPRSRRWRRPSWPTCPSAPRCQWSPSATPTRGASRRRPAPRSRSTSTAAATSGR
ncbi:MAG: hypothetical protein R2939_19735 [Kofleriaceae bacterium]